MTNKDVCMGLAAELGGYNGEVELETAGAELAIDLARETGLAMDAEADAASIAQLRSRCAVPLF